MSGQRLSTALAAAVRATIAQLREKPHLWGPLHLGVMLREHLPRPGAGFIYEMRDALGVSGLGSLKGWSNGLSAEEVVKELSRVLGET